MNPIFTKMVDTVEAANAKPISAAVSSRGLMLEVKPVTRS